MKRQETSNTIGSATTVEDELQQPLLSTTVVVVADDSDDVEVGVNHHHDNDNDNNNTTSTTPFSYKSELYEMFQLGIPLAISFFCRMGMASTDSSFVGHIHDALHTPETYLAAAVLSDMVVNVCITPPLAFNQVLNALVGQAMGSGNPKMAGIWLQQSMFWLSITMLPCLVGLFYVEPILLALQFPSDVAHVAGTYAKYNVLWPIPNGWYQCMRFYFQAQGLPRPAMYNNIVFLFINAFLNWIFVFGGPSFFHWNGFGFIGAAISLSISRIGQGLVYYIYMFVIKQHHLPTWPEAGWSFQHHTASRTREFMKQSIPNIGTLLFQSCANQATTVLVGRLGELSIAASSALSTVTIPWSGTLSATCSTVSSVRVGYHMGRGDANAARQSAWLMIYFITVVVAVVALVLFIPFFSQDIVSIATDDTNVLHMATTLIPAMLVGTYLNLLVGNITSGVFSGMGRPFIATLLSFGLELPLSIGGVAVYILLMHGNLLGVYWWQAISGGLEALLVFVILYKSNWIQCAQEAQQRQETPTPPPTAAAPASTSTSTNDDDDNAATTPLLADDHNNNHNNSEDNIDG